ncbi:MAG: sugar transferase [Bacteroides sp.]|nr:sugar transferase [Bacteroides sp.]
MKPYRNFFKRTIDIIASGSALLLLSVPLAAITAWLHFANKGVGAFFFQERPGKGGRIFKVVKFKTMTDERDAAGNLLPDAERLTKVGKFVRSTSIDELPQLWNVLKGDMSLIGPRPLRAHYLPLYSQEQARRHEVRPGITGWAQTHGRNNISWGKKFEYDVWYVDNISFLLDCKILISTVKKVFKREGITLDGQATTEAFNGHN